MYFTADRRWAGRTVACIASGPSLTAADCEAVRRAQLPAIAINNVGLDMAPWASVHYACDAAWWRAHPEALAADRLKICLDGKPPAGVHKMRCVSGTGFDDRRDTLRAGRNSGHQAVHLAGHFGARRIVLLGYDMQPGRAGIHYHGAHKTRPNPAARDLRQWCELFHPLAQALYARGVEVVNCSRETALRAFPQAALEDVLCAA